MLSFERRALPSLYARLSSFLIPTTLVINNGHNGDSNNQYKLICDVVITITGR